MVYMCVFLLRQESFDMILVNNPSFYDGGVTRVKVQAEIHMTTNTKRSCRQASTSV
jgi:hypothetical protein